jgi:pyruvate formate lyase activating enzyme
MIKDYINYPTVKKASLYKPLEDLKVKCMLCERNCILKNGDKGFCRTRINFEGTLYTLVYGDLSALESRPIEIKPFFHYWPGSTALTFSTWSCNFICPWCQNFHLSKTSPDPAKAKYISAEKIVNMALKNYDEGLCVSFQEPTLLFETALEAFKLASLKGLYCCFVSNGYMSLEALKALKDSGMDGLKIDIKGDSEVYKVYCGGIDVNKIWRNAREAKRMGIHVEIVNLIIPGVNDDEECIEWIIENHLKEVGAETPLHFTKYYPAYKFNNPPTPVKTLEKAYEKAKKAGVLYAYLGNVPGHKFENTYCPNCGKLLIKRYGYILMDFKLNEKNECPYCGFKINIHGKFIKKAKSLMLY